MSERTPTELQMPPIAGERGAIEILRVWGGPALPQQCSLLPTWNDPGAWGLLLVDVARHAAKAYASSGEYSEVEALARIKSVFEAEWANPTDEDCSDRQPSA